MKLLAQLIVAVFMIVWVIGLLCLIANLILPFCYPEALLYTALMPTFGLITLAIAASDWKPLDKIIQHLE